MFMTSSQLAASIQNKEKDSKFWNDPKRVAAHEQQAKEYEDFCKKFGYPA